MIAAKGSENVSGTGHGNASNAIPDYERVSMLKRETLFALHLSCLYVSG